MVIGSVLGIVLTLIAAYLLVNSNALKQSGTGIGTLGELREDDDMPLLRTFDFYSVDFKGRGDVLASRQKIRPNATLQEWDRAISTAKMPANLRFTPGCAVVAPTRAIFIQPGLTEDVLASKMNIHFVGADQPYCFGIGWKINIVEDDLIEGKTLFKVVAEATVDRMVEGQIDLTDVAFFIGAKLYRYDITYLLNPTYGPVTSLGPFTAIHFTLTPSKPLVDPNIVPDFIPGATTVAPSALKKLFDSNPRYGKPVLVDARDRAHVSENYLGAISVPFIPSNPVQTRFQLDFPISLLAGAKFDLRALPQNHETPLVIFGSDKTDASPIWVIRALRQQNYHRLYYVEGGFKEMQKLAAPIKF